MLPHWISLWAGHCVVPSIDRDSYITQAVQVSAILRTRRQPRWFALAHRKRLQARPLFSVKRSSSSFLRPTRLIKCQWSNQRCKCGRRILQCGNRTLASESNLREFLGNMSHNLIFSNQSLSLKIMASDYKDCLLCLIKSCRLICMESEYTIKPSLWCTANLCGALLEWEGFSEPVQYYEISPKSFMHMYRVMYKIDMMDLLYSVVQQRGQMT